ncbi:MAG: ribonuclease H-like domain-containing protein [Armatimonadetes bacterium]|nr:ribonuclease H-like domain-containing protein [Armatimonadota bacterium]
MRSYSGGRGYAGAAFGETAFRVAEGGPSLEEAIPGFEVAMPEGKLYYRVERPLEEVASWAVAVEASLKGICPALEGQIPSCRTKRLKPEEILFLDLETTGLGGTPLFLIGTMAFREGGLRLIQLLARSYDEEAAVLAALREMMKPVKILITFNGKTFDVPYVRSRAARWGVLVKEAEVHLDMLQKARSLYAGRFPNCKLQTLEQCVCGRTRRGDIPSAQIPRAYHEYLSTGNPTRLARVMEHNLIDLVTTAELMIRMMGG